MHSPLDILSGSSIYSSAPPRVDRLEDPVELTPYELNANAAILTKAICALPL
jgi:hypothetical protein